MHRLQQVEEGVFVGDLRGARDVAVAIFQRRLGIACRPEQVRKRVAPQLSAEGMPSFT